MTTPSPVPPSPVPPSTVPLPVGKVPTDILERVLPDTTAVQRIVQGPAVGEDAAIIDQGPRCLIAATDPITFAAEEIGWYAVHVNANDVACCGAAPRWFLANILLPEASTTEAMITDIFAQISNACGELGATLIGGHTEITSGLDRPIVVGTMLGEVASDRVIRTGHAQVGDDLWLTKGLAVEGTAILARECGDRLQSCLTPEQIAACGQWLHEPGISVVRDATVAAAIEGVHSLHDPTEGGIAGALFELARAANVGVSVRAESLVIYPECAAACDQLGLDPLGLIASGSLLIAADPSAKHDLQVAFDDVGIPLTRIGQLVPANAGCTIFDDRGQTIPIPTFARDEIARAFE